MYLHVLLHLNLHLTLSCRSVSCKIMSQPPLLPQSLPPGSTYTCTCICDFTSSFTCTCTWLSPAGPSAARWWVSHHPCHLNSYVSTFLLWTNKYEPFAGSFILENGWFSTRNVPQNIFSITQFILCIAQFVFSITQLDWVMLKINWETFTNISWRNTGFRLVKWEILFCLVL